VLAINSADDERNPPETGIMERELKRIKNVNLVLIPANDDTPVISPRSLRNSGSSKCKSYCGKHRRMDRRDGENRCDRIRADAVIGT
jgi:hypothetical protein